MASKLKHYMNQLTVIDNQQLQLPLPPGVLFTNRALSFHEAVSIDQWMDVGRFLAKSGESLDFWRADFIEHGLKTFGDEAVRGAWVQLGFEASDFKRSQLLTKLDLRDPVLSPEHHFVLAKSKLDGVGRSMWVELAKKESLSAAELQESIKKGSVVHIEREQRDGAAGVATWQGLAMQFDLLYRQIGDKWKSWSPQEIDLVLGKLAKIMAFISDLKLLRNG